MRGLRTPGEFDRGRGDWAPHFLKWVPQDAAGCYRKKWLLGEKFGKLCEAVYFITENVGVINMLTSLVIFFCFSF